MVDEENIKHMDHCPQPEPSMTRAWSGLSESTLIANDANPGRTMTTQTYLCSPDSKECGCDKLNVNVYDCPATTQARKSARPILLPRFRSSRKQGMVIRTLSKRTPTAGVSTTMFKVDTVPNERRRTIMELKNGRTSTAEMPTASIKASAIGGRKLRTMMGLENLASRSPTFG